MKFSELAIPGVFAIDLEPFDDTRGTLACTFCIDEFTHHGFETAGRAMQYFDESQACNPARHASPAPTTRGDEACAVHTWGFDVVVDLVGL